MKRFFLAVFFAIGSVISSAFATAAQPAITDDRFSYELTGDVIDLGTSGNIEFMPENYSVYRSAAVTEEIVAIHHGWSDFHISLILGDFGPQSYYDWTVESMRVFYTEFEIVEEEIEPDRVWFIALADYQGTEMVVYFDYEPDALGDTDMAILQFGPLHEVIEDISFIMDEVTVGGQQILSNADPEFIESVLTELQSPPAADSPPQNPDAGSEIIRPQIPQRESTPGAREYGRSDSIATGVFGANRDGEH